MLPSVAADSVLRYGVSEGDRIYYHWTGNRTVSSYTVELNHVVYIDFTYGVPENISMPYQLTHYLLFFENGTPIGLNVPGWPYNSTRPGTEIVEPMHTPLAPLPIGNWTYTSQFYEDPTVNIIEDMLIWTIISNTPTRSFQRTFTKSDGIVSHLIYQLNYSEYYSYYYDLVRIIDWAPVLVIGFVASVGVIAVVIVLLRRRTKAVDISHKEL